METTVNGMDVVKIPVHLIDADEEFNCRGYIAPIDVNELAQNIREIGLLQPGIVVPCAEGGERYKLIAGFRRFKAVQIIGWREYPCIVRTDLSEEDAAFFNLNENLQRKDLTMLQEAHAVAAIQRRFNTINREKIAEKVGKSPAWVQLRTELLQLPEDIQQEVNAGVITQPQMRQIYSVLKSGGMEQAYEVAREIKKAKQAGREPKIKKKSNRDKKTQRKRPEIILMLETMNESIPYEFNGETFLWPRCLAWACGEISDNDLFESCQEFCDAKGLTWLPPKDFD